MLARHYRDQEGLTIFPTHRIAQHVKRVVNYHVFTVMLWNEASQLLESVFAMHYDDAIPARLRMQVMAARAELRAQPVLADHARIVRGQWLHQLPQGKVPRFTFCAIPGEACMADERESRRQPLVTAGSGIPSRVR